MTGILSRGLPQVAVKLLSDGTLSWARAIGASGNLNWSRTFGGSGTEIGYRVSETIGGDLIMRFMSGRTPTEASAATA